MSLLTKKLRFTVAQEIPVTHKPIEEHLFIRFVSVTNKMHTEAFEEIERLESDLEKEKARVFLWKKDNERLQLENDALRATLAGGK